MNARIRLEQERNIKGGKEGGREGGKEGRREGGREGGRGLPALAERSYSLYCVAVSPGFHFLGKNEREGGREGGREGRREGGKKYRGSASFRYCQKMTPRCFYTHPILPPSLHPCFLPSIPPSIHPSIHPSLPPFLPPSLPPSLLPSLPHPGFACRTTKSISSLAPFPSSNKGLCTSPPSLPPSSLPGQRKEARWEMAGSKSAGG